MKPVVAILCIFCGLLQCSLKTIVCVQFYLQQDYISSTLCENKANPSSHCNGHCYLKKQLVKERSSNNHSIPNSLKEQTELLCIENTMINNVSIEAKKIFLNDRCRENLSAANIRDVYRPPSVI